VDFAEYLARDLGLKPSSIESYTVVVHLFESWRDIKDHQEELDWAQMRDFMGDLKQFRGYKNSALCHVYYALRALYKMQGLEHQVQQNPYRKVLREESTWVTEDMIQKIEVCRDLDPLDRALFLVLFSTAIRRGELLGLRVEDLEARPGFIRIARLKRQSGEKCDYLPLEGKVQMALLDYREKYEIRAGPLFPILKDTFYRRLKRGFKAAGVDYVKPHAFRHGRLTQASASMALTDVQRMAGHSSATTTAGYLHSSQASMVAAYAPAFGKPKKKTGFALRQNKVK
jgi:integrase